MQKTNYKYLIYFGIFIILSTTIRTLWKAGWFDQKTHDISKSDYQLNESEYNFSILLPNEPTKTTESENNSGIVFKTTHYKSLTPTQNQIIVDILSVECDTCSAKTKNDLVLRFLVYQFKSKNISMSDGIDTKIGDYNAYRFEVNINGVPAEYIACVVGDKGYIYGESFANVTKGVSSKYLESFKIK